jgi:hypothetical protein
LTIDARFYLESGIDLDASETPLEGRPSECMSNGRGADLRTADWSGHLEPGAYFQAFVPECSRPGRPDVARRLWDRHREAILQDYRRPARAGRRPWAWWVFDQGLGRVPLDEAAYLREHGLLEAWEEEILNKRSASAGTTSEKQEV